jgi:HAD superfamily hydrolase (TIGR01509 family)
LKNKIKAVVFDVDGLLLDTERIVMSAFFTACRKCNYEPDEQLFYRSLGGNETTSKALLLSHYRKDFPWDTFNAFWTEISDEAFFSKPIPVKPGVHSLLEYLTNTPVKIAIATSSQTQKAQKKLANAGITQHFDLVFGGDKVQHPKPYPDIYIGTCQKLNEEPAFCLALEDSDNGVRSALSAGLNVIQIPDLVPPSEEVKAFGHEIMDSLFDVQNILQEWISVS